MKYDCSKTLDYVHEAQRMCKTVKYCDDCPMVTMVTGERKCRIFAFIDDITQERIDIIQKWSDEHSEKTRAEAFYEMFPKNCNEGVPAECFYGLIGDLNSCENLDCDACWNELYNGEFEKAREEK